MHIFIELFVIFTRNYKKEVMDRTFHSRVGWWYWLLMGMTAFLLFDFFWFHQVVFSIVMAIVMIFEIEILIRIRYVVTSKGSLLIESGRFVPGLVLPLSSIEALCRIKSFSLAPALSVERVEIVYRSGDRCKKIHVSPRNEKEFIRWIEKKKEECVKHI